MKPFAHLLCVLAALNSVVVAAQDGGVRYLASVGGLDSVSAGTLTTPYATLNYALNQLLTNETLIIKDGQYGAFNYTCSIQRPGVTIVAQTPRLARFTGINSTLCDDWTIENLVFSGATVNGNNINGRVVFRGNLFSVADVTQFNGANSVIEANEFVGGFNNPQYHSVVQLNAGMVLRENYVTGISPGGSLVYAYLGASLIENNVVHSPSSYALYVGHGASNTRVIGNLAAAAIGFLFASTNVLNDGGLNGFVESVIAQNNVITELVATDSVGIRLLYARNARLEGNTLQGRGPGIGADTGAQVGPALGPGSASSSRNDIVGSIVVEGHNFSVAATNLVAPDGGTPIAYGHTGSFTQIDSRRRGCWAYPPRDGGVYLSDGGLLGAKNLFVSNDGLLTTRPLWHIDGGQFMGCGAVANGVNDDTTTPQNCRNIHLRFGVNSLACPLSDFYSNVGDGGSPDAGQVDAGTVDSGMIDAGMFDSGLNVRLLHFSSFPPPMATCGTSYSYQITTNASDAMLTLITSTNATLTGNTLRWNIPQGQKGTFTLTAQSGTQIVSQSFEVAVQCDSAGCNQSSLGTPGLILGLAMWLKTRRIRSSKRLK